MISAGAGATPAALSQLELRDRVDVEFTYATSMGTAPAVLA